MERKRFPAITTKVDEEQGIVEHIFAVFGNVDEGGDVIHPGAFTKTIAERGNKIRVLDQHQTDSVLRAVGKPLTLREIGRDELPVNVIERFPDATGGVKAVTQFLMDTPEGKGVFIRIKEGAIDEWSFGYDALDKDYSKITKDGKEITVRNIRTLKLYEYSPVLWGMNQATSTQSAKGKSPEEGKPWDVFHEGDKWVVYKINENGDKVGEALGSHDTEEEARAQVEALYANEGKETKGITDEDKTVLIREIGDLNMTDLVATHRRLHQFAAQGHILEGFSKSDMNWFHAQTEKELRKRAEDDGRDPPEASPLEWGSSKDDDEIIDGEGEEDKHFPGRVALIRARARAKQKDESGEKSLALSKLMGDICLAFDNQFNEQVDDHGWRIYKAFIREYYDDHVIACHSELKEYEWYEVPFEMNSENKIVFPQIQEWKVGGDYRFVVGAKADKHKLSMKSGRVIAKRNAERLAKIRELLKEIEEDGGLLEDDEPEIIIPKSKTASEKTADKTKAGPLLTPTSDDLLKLIEIEQLEISYMR
ncbi:MAG: HK97 family phage prohead protease [Candidatus Omnitrophica bacterium]|nr:HK97 family phage prohead protease [Candidatus Omnitrophota bacterium]